MIYLRFLFLGLAPILFYGCSSKPEFKSLKPEFKSLNPNAAYFYPLNALPQVYLYRDVANGLEEEFHRIYTITDQAGEHLIVERYSSDFRILEALNYNIDSLNVLDHMVVNRFQQKEKAFVYKSAVFPMDLNDELWFASKFSGLTDSTVIFYEKKRKFLEKKSTLILKKNLKTLVFNDKIIQSVLNPYSRKENINEAEMQSLFAEGLGLVEWYSKDKKVHFRLEKIFSQKEWVKIITR
jgi:hypothetical protein